MKAGLIVHMATERTRLGLAAEEAVCHHLKKLGYRILDRNWRRPWGELDVVAEHSGTIHFVEVKASRRLLTGFPPYARADGQKMHKVRRTAQTWLSAHRYGPATEWQLVVASVIMEPGTPAIELLAP
jgi:putative endonuclease